MASQWAHNPSIRTVRLSSGTLKIHLDANVFVLESPELTLLFDLLDLVNDFEADSEAQAGSELPAPSPSAIEAVECLETHRIEPSGGTAPASDANSKPPKPKAKPQLAPTNRNGGKANFLTEESRRKIAALVQEGRKSEALSRMWPTAGGERRITHKDIKYTMTKLGAKAASANQSSEETGATPATNDNFTADGNVPLAPDAVAKIRNRLDRGATWGIIVEDLYPCADGKLRTVPKETIERIRTTPR